MKPEIERRAVLLLREQSNQSLPLSRLHVALVAEAGPDVGTYGQLKRDLGGRTDLFVVLEPVDPLAACDAWPSTELRSEYEAALRGAAHEPGPRVILACDPLADPCADPVVDPSPRPPGRTAGGETAASLRRMDLALVDLWSRQPQDPLLLADLAAAMAETEEIRRAIEDRPGPTAAEVDNVRDRRVAPFRTRL